MRDCALAENNDAGELFCELNSNQRIFQEKLEALDKWKQVEFSKAESLATDIHPTADDVDENLYEAMIVKAFKKVTIENTYHYFARTIKVAESCIYSYKLVNYKEFYHYYTIFDENLRAICEYYLNK